jgi:hypothetical protein
LALREETEKEREPGKELEENEEETNEQKGIERNNSNHNNVNPLPLISLEVPRARRFKRIGNISEYSIQQNIRAVQISNGHKRTTRCASIKI